MALNNKVTGPQIKAIMTDFSTPEATRKATRYLLRGMIVIFQYQTEAEKAENVTKEDNGVGYNGTDAGIMSDFAKRQIKFLETPTAKILESQGKVPHPFTPNQFAIIKKCMPKYAGQLARIANEKAGG